MSDGTRFLYPFLEGDEHDAAALLADLERSAASKASASRALRATTLDESRDTIEASARAMRDRFEGGGRLLTFGNGGSSTDAATLAALFAHPPHGVPLPARALVDDTAILTALGNDVGFDLVFSRQVIAHGRNGDIALGISTSGNSRNLLQAFAEADARGLLTVGLAGYAGGDMAQSPHVQHCLVVRADSVHRIQETQAALGHALWDAIQQQLASASGHA